MTTVLVTGVGAVIGYGILRSLRAARPEVRLVGTDLYRDAVGQAWCDSFIQAPLTDGPDYLPWLQETVERQRVDLLIPGIEPDLLRLSRERGQLEGGRCRIALNTPALVELCRDKWDLHQALVSAGAPCRIPSVLEGNFETLATLLGLPFLLKPRRGSASKGIVTVASRADFEPHAHLLGAQLLAQPVVGTDEEEYTVGAFGDGTGGVAASIGLRRLLGREGSTQKAWVSDPPGLADAVHRLCAQFRPLGPTNLQFRRDGAAWKLLEINPRISSSTSIRCAFGYNEAAMCLDYFLAGRLPVQPPITRGFASRYIEDYVVYDRDNF